MEDWLHARHDVVAVRRREDISAIDVDYTDGGGARGSFVRSLRDRIFVIHESTSQPIGFALHIVHAIRGRIRLRIDGATDEAMGRLAAWIAEHPGVLRATASPASASILVAFDPAITSDQKIAAAVRLSHEKEWPRVPVAPPRGNWPVAAMNTAVFAASLTGFVPPPAMGLAVAATAIPAARRMFAALGEQRLSVDVLDLAAIGISLGMGRPVTASFITWLLGIGDLVLAHTADSARAAIGKLMHLDATEAFRLRGDVVERIAVKKIAVGDRLIVEAGGRIAADGIVESGIASVDEKALTGESVPRERKSGDRVLSATVVVDGQLIVRVDRVGTDTTALKIVAILEGAGAKPMTLQRRSRGSCKQAGTISQPPFASWLSSDE